LPDDPQPSGSSGRVDGDDDLGQDRPQQGPTRRTRSRPRQPRATQRPTNQRFQRPDWTPDVSDHPHIKPFFAQEADPTRRRW
jgi:hypothetical protein